jgi:Tfp pilus assembly protein PilF
MEDNKKSFSKSIKKMKSLFKRVEEKLKPVKKVTVNINKKIKKIFKKIWNLYIEANKKNKYTEPIIVITSCCLFVLVMVLALKGNFTVKEVNITKNSAEVLYYNNKYDEAIVEYGKMQEKEKWPSSLVKSADIYSLKMEREKSTNVLKEAIIKRDKIIIEEEIEDYKDKELINDILFTFYMNKDYGEAISFGEQYIKEKGYNNDIVKTLFASYLANNFTFKAEEIISKYELNENSAFQLAEVANMNMLINKWDEGLSLLNKGLAIDKNEIKIYEVLEEMKTFDKTTLIEKLNKTIEENPSDDSYKIMLAKVYSKDKTTASKGEELLTSIKDVEGYGASIDLIKYDIYNNLGDITKAQDSLEKAEKKAKEEKPESSYYYYVLGLKEFSLGNLDEALLACKKSIIANEKESNVYISLMPDLLSAKEEYKKAEVYLREYIHKNPFSYRTIIKFANYYMTEGSNNKAREYYEIALNIRKDDENLYQSLVNLDVLEENWENGIEKMNMAIKTCEENSNFYRTLGTLYFNNEEYDKGIENIRKAYEMNEKDVLALNNASWYYINIEKDVNRAYENIKTAYDEMPVSLDENTKKSISDNYTRIKAVYDSLEEGKTPDYSTKDLKLFY